MIDVLFWTIGAFALFGVGYWYFEVYTPRKHTREAFIEAEAAMQQQHGADWRERSMRRIPPRPLPAPAVQGGNVNPPPTYAKPPAPPAPPAVKKSRPRRKPK